MTTELMEWIVPLFFLGSLVMVSQLERQISSVSRQSYRQIAGGLSLLAVVSVAVLYRGQGMFGNLPFLSEALFFDLVSWTFAITGSILVLSGVAQWLPMARKMRQVNESAIRKLNLLKRVEQLLGVENRLDQILTTSVDYMVEHHEMSFGAVYKYSPEKQRMRYLAGTFRTPTVVGDFEPAHSTLERLEQFSAGRVVNLVKLFADLPESVGAPATVLPLIVDRQPIGLFVLWSASEVEIAPEDDLTLRLVISAIARKIAADRQALEHASEARKRSWKQRLEIIVSGARSAREAFSPFVQCLGQRIPMEFAALAFPSAEGDRMRRLSWGPGGGVLVETDLSIPIQSALTAEAYREGETVVINDLGSERDVTTGELVTDGNVQSLLAVPVLREGTTIAVLTLATRQAGAYGDWEMTDLEAALPVLDRLISDELARIEIRKRDHRLNRLSRMVRETSGIENLNQVFAEAAGLISDEIGADIVRISTPNTEGAFLKSRTLVMSRPFETIVPSNGEMIVSLMPVHEQVLNYGQAMLNGAGSTGASLVEFESQQAFAFGVQSSLIAPVSVEGEVAAVISTASMSKSRQLHRDSGALTFVESVARYLTAAIQRLETPSTESQVEPLLREITPADHDILADISTELDRRWSREIDVSDEMMNCYRAVLERPTRQRNELAPQEL